MNDVDLAILAAEGEPSQVLLEHSTGAILILIGNHHRSMLRRLLGRS